MLLAKVKGNVVATTKDTHLNGHKLLIVKPFDPESKIEKDIMVAVDTVGAGFGEIVLISSGSSARRAESMQSSDSVVDAAIVAIVDNWEYQGE